MSIIIDTVLQHLPPKRKKTPSGWVSFNCVACTDSRSRAGIHVNDDGMSYHCFNCGFKAGWNSGKLISKNFKALMELLFIPDDVINKCYIEAIRLRDNVSDAPMESSTPRFFSKPLPKGAKPISKWLETNYPSKLLPVLQYMEARMLYLDEYDWHWTNEIGFNNRLIIPFTYQDRIVGYTGRDITNNAKQRYMSEQQPGYVFNLDKQHDDREFVIVCEGPIDAISIGGVSLLGSKISNGQHILLNQLHKEIVVVPDRDEAGAKLVKQSMEHDWSVSFPEWDHGINDINDAVRAYGRLYTLYSIALAKTKSKSKIKVLSTGWFK